MNKKTLILAGVLVILIAMAYIYQVPIKNWQEKLGKPNNFLTKIDIDSIDRIEITSRGETTILENKDGRLKVVGTKDFFVRGDVVDDMFQKLKEAQESDLELISTNQEKKQEFNTGMQGVGVKILGDKRGTLQLGSGQVEFIVGKMAGDFVSTYISQTEIPNTYSVKTNLFSVFNVSDWRDDTIFFQDKNSINKIRFQYPRLEFVVENVDGVWVGTSPYKFDVSEEKIGKIVDLLSNLRSAFIPEQSFQGTGLEKNLIIIQAMGDGVDSTIMIGEANKDDLYYAKRGDSDNIYLITKEQRDELDKQTWQFK